MAVNVEREKHVGGVFPLLSPQEFPILISRLQFVHHKTDFLKRLPYVCSAKSKTPCIMTCMLSCGKGSTLWGDLFWTGIYANFVPEV
jgi:hypothetical protein